MVRKFWLALSLTPLMTTTACTASSDPSIALSCEVSGAHIVQAADFAALLCDRAAAQLRETTSKTVDVTAPEAVSSDAPWLHLVFAIKSPYAVSAKASWGGADTNAGESAEVEAGIDDASLNEATADMLVRALLGATPFAAKR